MVKTVHIRLIFLVLMMVIASKSAFAQSPSQTPIRSMEISESDGIPVLMKHLPNWETVRARTTFANNVDPLKNALGARPVLDQIDFSLGTEAVTAQYDAGKLLIIEYTTPQASVEADTAFQAKLAEGGDVGKTVYRRIGNYNAFVFDAVDESSANALLDQVKYEKYVQWLGKNPFLQHQAERAFVITTSDIFLSTLFVILIGIAFSIVGGIVSGYVFFNFRERKRASMPTFSDAGGMTRLNLDGLTPDIIPKKLIGE